MQQSVNLAGVVVLYFPDQFLLHNIDSYIDSLGLLVIVDNTPLGLRPYKERLQALKKVIYLDNGTNLGIAKALNMGVEKALDGGFDWILTMDQDSRFEPGALDILLMSGIGLAGFGIISPQHVLVSGQFSASNQKLWSEVNTVFTSGNLLNLSAYRVAGPFLEKLFVDFVDNEYCLRLKKLGYKIYVVHASKLVHSWGRVAPIRFFGRDIHPSNHTPIRHYYMSRNRLYVIREYPEFFNYFFSAWVKEMFRIAFERDRILKLFYISRGIVDFFLDRYGPLRLVNAKTSAGRRGLEI